VQTARAAGVQSSSLAFSGALPLRASAALRLAVRLPSSSSSPASEGVSSGTHTAGKRGDRQGQPLGHKVECVRKCEPCRPKDEVLEDKVPKIARVARVRQHLVQMPAARNAQAGAGRCWWWLLRARKRGRGRAAAPKHKCGAAQQERVTNRVQQRWLHKRHALDGQWALRRVEVQLGERRKHKASGGDGGGEVGLLFR
jgi:hypothetical protein